MEHQDFEKKQKSLHLEMTLAIMAIMVASGTMEIHFDTSSKPLPKVLRFLDLCNQYELVYVAAVKIEDGTLYYKAFTSKECKEEEESWWNVDKSVAASYLVELYDFMFGLLIAPS